MKKGIAILLVLCFVFASCANKNEESAGGSEKSPEASIAATSQTSTSPSATPKATTTNGEKPKVKKEVTGLRQISMKNDQVGCGTEKGFYYIAKEWVNDTPGSYICYFDYETMKESYLCKESNCKHTDSKCTSNITDQVNDAGGVLFTDGKHLYLLVNFLEKEGSLPTSSVSAEREKKRENGSVLYCMDMDGSNREEVYEFKKGEVVNNKIFYDGEKFIMLVEKLKTVPVNDEQLYVQAESKEVISFSPDSNQREKICDIEKELKIAGCAEEFLIFAKEEYDVKYKEEKIAVDAELRAEAVKTKIVSIFKLDMKSGKQSAVKQIVGEGDKSYFVANDRLYYGVEQSGKIMEVDVKTGEEKTLGKTDFESIVGCTDEALICKSFNLYDTASSAVMNLQSGDTQEMKLLIDNSMPLTIMDSSLTKYLVAYKHSDDFATLQYALISAEDYVAQQEQYEEFEMTSGGWYNNFETFDSDIDSTKTKYLLG